MLGDEAVEWLQNGPNKTNENTLQVSSTWNYPRAVLISLEKTFRKILE